MKDWLRARSLTLVMMGCFSVFLAGQVWTGWYDHNDALAEHGAAAVTLRAYLTTGHMWEALFENWESEFLQMAAFVTFTAVLVQQGSPESRRLGALELVDADPREFAQLPDVPWPVRRGGWVLFVYERSLGLVLFLLFAISWMGHALGGWSEYVHDQRLHGEPGVTLFTYVSSSRFWFESFQNLSLIHI